MEEDEKKLNIDDKKLELKKLLMKDPKEESEKEVSASNNDSKTAVESCVKAEDKKTELTAKKESKEKGFYSEGKSEDSCKKLGNSSVQEIDKPKSPSPTPPLRNSPEPSCAICLEHLTNKSFTNSCFHMFCFTCLLEWSKVKPECPLCKQSFTSIVHNVRSFQEYDQYHISARSKTPDGIWSFDRRFRYSTTMTPDRYMSRAQAIENEIVNEMASHRLRFAPHAVGHARMINQSQIARRIPCVYRRRVYDENLWVHRLPDDRVRLATPAFFRRNIACTHRLIPWLNRELLVVMPHSEGDITFMIDLIMSLILKYHITSPEFYTHIEPYTAEHTSHFIHEFYHFAISPYEMTTYDFHAEYDVDLQNNFSISSPDSDVIPIPVSETSQRPVTSSEPKRKKKTSSSKQKTGKCKQHLSKIVLKRNSANNCWETVASSIPLPLFNFNEVSSSNALEVPGPSTSWDSVLRDIAERNNEIERNDEIECLQDDEIEIVSVLKPKCERTPEIVDLSSGDEEFFPNTEVSSTTNKTLDDVLIDLSSDIALSSADEDDVLFLEEKNTVPKSAISDAPIDYSIKSADKTIEIVSEKSKSDTELSSQISRENAETESSPEPKKEITLNSIVTVVSKSDHDNYDSCSSHSPIARSRKRRTISLNDSSTESCSEGTQVTDFDSSIKKLKLRSVVAHFSIEESSEKTDSTQHSSHKRRKAKKTRKKKHKHKRHHCYSSDSA